MTWNLARPNPDQFGPFGKYISLVPAGDIAVILDAQLASARALLRDRPEEESLVQHPPYTWSIRDVMGHVTDAERIFAYRALRLARHDATPLSSFDENAYVNAAAFDQFMLADLLEDFAAVRCATIQLVRRLDASAWERRGTVSGIAMTAAGMIYAIAGHCQHHLQIVRSRLGAS